MKIKLRLNKGISFFAITVLTIALLVSSVFLFAEPDFTARALASVSEETINSGWKHTTGIEMDNANPSVVKADYSTEELKKWQNVNIPHTWNTHDGQDGGANFLRTVGWYRKTLNITASEVADKKVYIEFLGSSIITTLYVNGVQIDEPHKGGYTAFRYDITDELIDGDNLIAVKVDNRYDDTVAPLSGDFNVYGGIYRDVKLIITNQVHVDMNDFASSGLYLTTKNVTVDSATIEVKANIVNDSNQAVTVDVSALLFEPNTFEEISTITNPRFDVQEMASDNGTALATQNQNSVNIAPGGSYTFEKSFNINNPKLWAGMENPFRYMVRLDIKQGNDVLHSVTEYVGLRFFEVKLTGNRDTDGFYLNGELYPLRGVNRHQDWEDMGYAITRKEHDIDFGMIYEIGANCIRLAHYPHDPYFYELCDKYGIVVWAEIPLVDKISSSENFAEFKAVTLQQLEELIKQQYNRPSIMFWGLQNELNNGGRLESDTDKANAKQLMKELNTLAHNLDSTRYTTQATNNELAYDWESDLVAWNTYPGWYGGDHLDVHLNRQNYGYCTDITCTERNDCKNNNHKKRPVGISEYGSGGNVLQHKYNHKLYDSTSNFHPEEYQTQNQKDNIEAIMNAPYTWCTFLWNMFEFASDWRDEGANPGINDKGLVTHDRQIKKDSFYAYKAWWNKDEVTLHIDSRRFENQKAGKVPIKISSNCAEVELFITNDKNERVSLGKISSKDATVGLFYEWEKVKLVSGYNKIQAVGYVYGSDNKTIEQYYYDEVIWLVKPDLALILGLSLGLGIPSILAVVFVVVWYILKKKKSIPPPHDTANESV